MQRLRQHAHTRIVLRRALGCLGCLGCLGWLIGMAGETQAAWLLRGEGVAFASARSHDESISNDDVCRKGKHQNA